MSNKKQKKLHKVICFHGAYNTFIEAGLVENPTFKNEIYLSISAKHKNGKGLWFFRVDEAFIINGLIDFGFERGVIERGVFGETVLSGVGWLTVGKMAGANRRPKESLNDKLKTKR